jgi:hypothetical protein
MIRAEELMIGNWVYDSIPQRGVMRQVKAIGDGGVSLPSDKKGVLKTYKFIDCFEIHPIPLTPDIMSKCVGFENDYGESWIIWIGKGYTEGTKAISVNFFTNKFQISICKGGENMDYIILPIPKHLHIFQNLYYSLTNKNLNIQL